MCIPTPNTHQLSPMFHTFAEFRPIGNRVVARHSTGWLAAYAQFSPNDGKASYFIEIPKNHFIVYLQQMQFKIFEVKSEKIN